MQYVDSCESGMQSIYLNKDGIIFPCSFSEGEEGWEEGIDMENVSDFLKDVWFHPKMNKWRENLIKTTCNSCRNCPIYNI